MPELSTQTLPASLCSIFGFFNWLSISVILAELQVILINFSSGSYVMHLDACGVCPREISIGCTKEDKINILKSSKVKIGPGFLFLTMHEHTSHTRFH